MTHKKYIVSKKKKVSFLQCEGSCKIADKGKK